MSHYFDILIIECGDAAIFLPAMLQIEYTIEQIRYAIIKRTDTKYSTVIRKKRFCSNILQSITPVLFKNKVR